MVMETPAAVEREVRELQEKILEDCRDALQLSESQFWIFVHVRSIALRKEGRSSTWGVVRGHPSVVERACVRRALSLQYLLETDLRTYNELFISGEQGEESQPVGASFGFGNDADGVDIRFDNDSITAATLGLNFNKIADSGGLNIKAERRRQLAEARLSLGLNESVRLKFNLGAVQLSNPLKALPEEVRYALQILMLWSNTLRWKYIETYHSHTRFDALSGLVITVCSCERRLDEGEAAKIEAIVEKKARKLDSIADKKTDLFPRPQKPIVEITDTIEERLTIRTASGKRLWEGRYVFQVIETLRNSLFASTFEGVPESYSFILGHPGFIARPKDLRATSFIRLDQIRQYREKCEGALDTLNVVDVLGHPPKNSSRVQSLKLLKLSLVPIAFPPWAKRWEDTEQAFGSSLEALSSVHQETVVVGMMCRNIIMVYKAGELVCVFNGAWQEIKSWDTVVENLKIPTLLANQPRLREIYRLLTRIAFGPLPRSVIVGFAKNERAYKSFEREIQSLNDLLDSQEFLEYGLPLEPLLMRATKTDGAILAYPKNRSLFFRSRARVTSQVVKTKRGAVATGTGDATAQSMARKGSDILSIKVSRDGGMKIRWDGRGPEIAAITIEG